MDASVQNNVVGIPVGIKFSIGLFSKRSNALHPVKIIKGQKTNNFYATFDEEDVDFQLYIDNSICPRGIRFTLIINGKGHPFYIRPGIARALQTLHTFGRKLHFKSQNTDEGQLLLAQTANKYGMDYSEAAVVCSEITFRIEVEKLIESGIQIPLSDNTIIGQLISVNMQTLAGKSVHIDIGTLNTIANLKKRFAELEGTSTNQTLIFNSKTLDNDNKSLQECGIGSNSIIYVTLNPGFMPMNNSSVDFLNGGNRNAYPNFNVINNPFGGSGGAEVTDCFTEPIMYGARALPTTFGANPLPNATNSQTLRGERGVICYGEQSNQSFGSYSGFVPDYDLIVNEFTIELRMASKYSPI